MQPEHTKYEWIDAYIRQELKGEKLNAFEAELKKNEALRREVQFRQSIDDAFQLEKVEATIQKAKSDPLLENANALKIENPELENVHDVIHRAKSENLSYRKKLVKRLAVVGLAASVLLLGWTANQHWIGGNNLDKWVDHHFSTPPQIELNDIANIEIESVSARNDEILDLLAEAKRAYKADKRADVLVSFGTLRKEYSYETDAMLLYEGLIYYQENELLKAVETLKQITNRNSAMNHEAHWYLGLMYLKMNEKDEAKKHFKKLTAASGKYGKKAITALKKLN